MSRYIDADNLHILDKGKMNEYTEFGIGFNDGLKFAEAEIDRIPTEDVVKIVKCKDCFIHGYCSSEDMFHYVGIEEPFCCLGGRQGKCAEIEDDE